MGAGQKLDDSSPRDLIMIPLNGGRMRFKSSSTFIPTGASDSSRFGNSCTMSLGERGSLTPGELRVSLSITVERDETQKGLTAAGWAYGKLTEIMYYLLFNGYIMLIAFNSISKDFMIK